MVREASLRITRRVSDGLPAPGCSALRLRCGFLPAVATCVLVLCASDTTRAQNAPAPPVTGRMLQQLDADDWILRAEALRYLGDHRIAAAVEPIRAILNNERVQPWVRGQALVALARIDAQAALQDATQFAQHAEPQLRVAAAEALEQLPTESGGGLLQVLLQDESAEVRYCALATHARRHGADAWPLVEPMTRSLEPAVYQAGTRALAFVATDEALARLAELSAAQARWRPTVRGVGDIPNPTLIPLLLRILVAADPDSHEFATILTALARHERADLLSALKDALDTGDQGMIRTVALVVTRLVRSPDIGGALRRSLENVDDVETIKTGLAALGPRDMEPDRYQALFAAKLNHPDVDIRALAIRCLAHCKNVNMYDALRQRIGDDEPTVVHAALGALLRAPVDTAPRGRLVEYLRVALDSDDETSRNLAYELLGHAGAQADFQPALAVLGDLLRSTDDARRNAAAEALGKIAPPDGVERLVRTQGYVANWMILGTFLNDLENKGFNQKFPPEDKIDFTAKYKAKYVWTLAGEAPDKKGEIEREIGWTQAAVDRSNGMLNIPTLVPPPATLSVAYAVADFRSETARDVLLSVDGDDAFRVWLNGEQIVEAVAEFKHRTPCVAEQKDLKIRLRAGGNRFVVKTTNIDHQWWVRLRLTDDEGRPVEVPAP